MMLACTPFSLAYTDPRGVETSLQRPTAPDSQRLFCAPRLESVHGLEGTGIPEYRPPSVAVSNLQAAHHWVPLRTSKTYRSASHGQ